MYVFVLRVYDTDHLTDTELLEASVSVFRNEADAKQAADDELSYMDVVPDAAPLDWQEEQDCSYCWAHGTLLAIIRRVQVE